MTWFFLSVALIALVFIFWKRKSKGIEDLKNYSVIEVKEHLTGKYMVLLDVRSARERQERCIEGSLFIPLRELSQRLSELEPHREKEIVCYCAVGSRSQMAASILKQNGFRAANMIGGITAWTIMKRQQ